MNSGSALIRAMLSATLLCAPALADAENPADSSGQADSPYAWVDDYTYLDVVGSLFYESPISPKVGDKSIDFNGDAVFIEASVALHPNVRLIGSYTDGVSSSNQKVFVGGVNVGKASITFQEAFGALGWNHTLGERASVYFDLGGLWGKDSVKLKGGAVGAQKQDSGDQWGFIARAGIRGVPFEKLPKFEMEGQFAATNMDLTNNLIFFSGTLRYNIWGGLAPEVAGQVGTDSFAAFMFGLRVFPKQLYRTIAGP